MQTRKVIGDLWQKAKRRKRVSVLVLVAIVGGILIGRSIYLRARPPEYKTAAVTKADLTQTIEVSGEVQAEETVDLHFQTIGKLAWIGVKEGDRVKKWQAVAGLDKRTLEKQLRQDLNDFEKELRDYGQAVSDNPQVSDRFKRILEQAHYDLTSAIIDVEIKNLAIELATLVSPIEGIVTRVDTPVAGVNLTASDTISIVNPDTMYFEAEVDETDVSSASTGDKAIISLDAYENRDIRSQVTWIDFTASTSEGGGTVFLVKLALPVIEGIAYRKGFNGDVSIIVEEKKDVLSLPFDAVDKDDEGPFVVVYKDGAFVRQTVATGLETDDEIEIVAGLKEGSEVVLPGSVEGKIDVQKLRRG